MAQPYADLQVQSLSVTGDAKSGQPLTVNWTVANKGIGITDKGGWSDRVWLSSQADGSGIIAELSRASHLGALAPDDSYSHSLAVNLPEGLNGTYYLNVRTGGVFEFIYTENNSQHLALPITLSPSPDLIVETVSAPTTTEEGSLIDLTWTVLNQGTAEADGIWVDNVSLVPISGTGTTIQLGSFSYDRGLASGIRYTRTEQVRLPTKLIGAYRLQVVTNAQLGSTSTTQVYEYGTARTNNSLTATNSTDISPNTRPDLRVTNLEVPTDVTAGASAAVRYTVANQGAAGGHWQDRVYLSQDGILSADDLLVGSFDNGSALASTESYANTSAQIDIPIRYRGTAYLIVVADGNNAVDEYQNEANNTRAAAITINSVFFADLVMSQVVAPDQAVHGSTIDVRYTVSNPGAALTRGASDNINQWADSIWLARDPRRPGAYKGDILLSTITHTGKLAKDENYQGQTQVTLPENILSGQYFLTVWTDTYDVILEDTLATQTNSDDPTQFDNNNYKARAISILGITPPDLVVTAVTGTDVASAEGLYTFSYTVKNQGDELAGEWKDHIYLTDNPDWQQARAVWDIGVSSQGRTLANGESYTVTQTVSLAPSVTGRYLVVRTDQLNNIKESDDNNNSKSTTTLVTAPSADLQVTAVTTPAVSYSGEDTTVSWTVTNKGSAVWSGTQTWEDLVIISTDPVFLGIGIYTIHCRYLLGKSWFAIS
jgi:subtilase family serine protease